MAPCFSAIITEGKTFVTSFYRISSLIRQCFSFQNNHKNLDPSYKRDLDLWDCLERVKLVLQQKLHRTDLIICTHSREGKTPSYSRTNMVTSFKELFQNASCSSELTKMKLAVLLPL